MGESRFTMRYVTEADFIFSVCNRLIKFDADQLSFIAAAGIFGSLFFLIKSLLLLVTIDAILRENNVQSCM